jgi:hypothetical protein
MGSSLVPAPASRTLRSRTGGWPTLVRGDFCRRAMGGQDHSSGRALRWLREVVHTRGSPHFGCLGEPTSRDSLNGMCLPVVTGVPDRVGSPRGRRARLSPSLFGWRRLVALPPILIVGRFNKQHRSLVDAQRLGEGPFSQTGVLARG